MPSSFIRAMNSEYLQNLKQKLLRRVERLALIEEHRIFHYSLKQFWSFLNNNPIFADIFSDLASRFPSMNNEAKKIVTKNESKIVRDEIYVAPLAYFVIKLCVESTDNQIESKTGVIYAENADPLKYFKLLFLRPLCEYLEEQLDEQKIMLAFLRRYKQKCEQFQRDILFKIWHADTPVGEKKLALHLYEYLYDQGLDIVIEPSSVSGRVDLIAAQKSDYPLIADAKIFNPKKGKGKQYLAEGFNQIYIYTQDYNEPFGYLIIFNTAGNDLRFSLNNPAKTAPFIVHNNKTIFIITIDIYPHKTSASKRGKLKSFEITENDLISIIKSQKNA